MLQPFAHSARFGIQAGLVLSLLAAGVPVQAATQITACGFAVTMPGTYNVANDLVCSTHDGVDIKASNVTLNLGGHKMTESGGSPVGININAGGTGRLSNILIEGPGLIQGFLSGIQIADVDSVKVDQVTLLFNSEFGLVTQNVTNLSVTSSVIAGNGQYGLAVYQSINGSIEDNEVSSNGFYPFINAPCGGIITGQGSNNRVLRNTVNGNHGLGIQLGDMGSSASNNTIIGNPIYGILAVGTGSVLEYNTSAGNSMGDMLDQNASCGSDHWQYNTFFTSNQGCIH